VRLGQQLNLGYSQLLTYKESLGSIYAYNLRLADAEKWMRDVVDQSIEKNGRLSATTASVQTTLAEILVDTSKLEEALAAYEAAVDSFEKNSGGNDFIGSARYWGYGRALLGFGNLQDAEIALRKAKENRERTLPNTLFSARILETTAICLAEMGRAEEAYAALSTAHELLLKFGRVKGSDEQMVHQLAKARVYFVSNRSQEAIAILREIRHSGPTLSSAPVRALAIRSLLAETLFAAGEDVESRSAVVEIRFALASKSADAAIPLLNAKLDLIDGAVKLRAGDAAGALPLLEKALTERAMRLSPSSPFLAEAYLWVARAKVALGKRDEAGTLFKKASEVRAKNKQLGEHFERQFREVSSILSATR
jgi:tetratricopeptide (TPR) repeat protein